MLEGNVLEIIIKVIGFVFLIAFLIAIGTMIYSYSVEWFGSILEKISKFDSICEKCGEKVNFSCHKCQECGNPISKQVRTKYKLRAISVSLLAGAVLLFVSAGTDYIVFSLFVAGVFLWIYQKYILNTTT
jgi:ribosomal protein L40E